jgi:hypothetical protein
MFMYEETSRQRFFLAVFQFKAVNYTTWLNRVTYHGKGTDWRNLCLYTYHTRTRTHTHTHKHCIFTVNLKNYAIRFFIRNLLNAGRYFMARQKVVHCKKREFIAEYIFTIEVRNTNILMYKNNKTPQHV